MVVGDLVSLTKFPERVGVVTRQGGDFIHADVELQILGGGFGRCIHTGLDSLRLSRTE